MSIQAVFDSWNGRRAKVYRAANKIPDTLGTAVNIQTMVFGNMGMSSGTGVCFTRNPSTGVRQLYGEFLLNAQGEDVVAGVRTPQPIAQLEREMSQVHKQLLEVCRQLEKHFRDMQDIEFTIERGRLFILQTRSGKRTATATIKIAAEMVQENLITKEEALLRVQPAHVEQLLHRQVDPKSKIRPIATGLPASPGAAHGKVIFDTDEAHRLGSTGGETILVRPETTPEDIHGMIAARGVLTSRGGMTSHAAVVARGMGKPAVVGCESIKIDVEAERFIAGDLIVKKEDIITIDGTTGNVMSGEVATVEPELSAEAKQVLGWADEIRTMHVRANADTPEGAAKALQFGAEGIGLCRTERMFNAQDRLPVVREMILAVTDEERSLALARLLPLQREDFKAILRTMSGRPVTVRLLDLPLHEFLPSLEELERDIVVLEMKDPDSKELAQKKALVRKVLPLSEHNPMLGHRGCRLAVSHPEIYEMQVRAIFEAAAELAKQGGQPNVEIMLPLVGEVNEVRFLKERLRAVAGKVIEAAGVSVTHSVGTMIEVPRAAITADEIASEVDFFSFGTNDLTQTTFAYSRDDAEGKFLKDYFDHKILSSNPFEVLDRDGVGRLMRISVDAGRKTNPSLKVGICGEHGGEPSSVEFCHELGLDYVSCSPYRVPVARLVAAQAVVRKRAESSENL
jgi:pyruvate,orthophosphate dikinase